MSTALEVPSLIYQLICHLRGESGDNKSLAYEATISMFRSDKQGEVVFHETDEFYVLELLKKNLASQNKEGDVIRLEELYYRLKRTGTVQNPISILIFFYALSCARQSSGSDRLNLLYLNKQVPNYEHFRPENGTDNYSLKNGVSIESLDNLGNRISLVPLRKHYERRHTQRPHTIHLDSSAARNEGSELISSPCSRLVTKNELLRELTFALQGLNGKILMQDVGHNNCYKINPQYTVDPPMASHALRIANVGIYYSKILKYCDRVSRNESVGYICQSFAEALREELRSYCRLVTMIDQKNHSLITSEVTIDQDDLSLNRLEVLIFDSATILRNLVLLIEQCRDKHGGDLINVVYKYVHHGDPLIRACMNRIMSYIVLPLRKMLSCWIFYGELNDAYREFFIYSSRAGAKVTQTLPSDNFWHEKYSINSTLLPNFISEGQAKQILATGKAVTLLKQLGTSNAEVTYFEELKHSFEEASVDKLFSEFRSVEKSEFLKLLTLAYKETSQKALRILYNEFNFLDHLQGMRQFLLLGQGDFIQHLMDKLATILNKPAEQLRSHNLNSLLVSAIRSTNAEYMIEDVTERLDVAFGDFLPGMTGWEVFTLTYQTKGAISTVFTQSCMDSYNELFRYLWTSKRMEYILASLWKKLFTCSRSLNRMPNLRNVLRFVNILLSEMMHFVQQMQYYIRFEVLECCWDTLEKKVNAAEDIDQLVEAQRQFLVSVTCRLMLESPSLSTQLRAIYDAIIDFERIINHLLVTTEIEGQRREQFDNRRTVLVVTGQTSTSDEGQEEFKKRRKFEENVLADFKIKIQMLSGTYENMVQKFLMLLADQYDAELRFLSFRLDFNEHYSRRNKSLESSFTYFRHKALESSRIIDSI